MYSEPVLEHVHAQYQRLLTEAEQERRARELLRQRKAVRPGKHRRTWRPRAVVALVQPTSRIV